MAFVIPYAVGCGVSVAITNYIYNNLIGDVEVDDSDDENNSSLKLDDSIQLIVTNVENDDISIMDIESSCCSSNSSSQINVEITDNVNYLKPPNYEEETSKPIEDNKEVVEHEVVLEPEVNEPVVNEPVVNEPVVNEPVVNEPLVNEPVVNEPVVNEPVVNEPVVNEPVVNEPVVNEPVVNEPLVNEPIEAICVEPDSIHVIQEQANSFNLNNMTRDQLDKLDGLVGPRKNPFGENKTTLSRISENKKKRRRHRKRRN